MGQTKESCFLHREALVSKSTVPELQKVLTETIKMVNSIKTKVVFSTVFCHDSCSHSTSTDTEVSWLSPGQVPSRLQELREELLRFLTSEGSETANLLSGETWRNKGAFLAEQPEQEYVGQEWK